MGRDARPRRAIEGRGPDWRWWNQPLEWLSDGATGARNDYLEEHRGRAFTRSSGDLPRAEDRPGLATRPTERRLGGGSRGRGPSRGGRPGAYGRPQPRLPDPKLPLCNRPDLARGPRQGTTRRPRAKSPGTRPPDRELAEETGYRAGSIRRIAEWFVSPGVMSEKMFLYLCEDLQPGPTDHQADERLEPVILEWSEAFDQARPGRTSNT